MLRHLLISTGLLAIAAGPMACHQPKAAPPAAEVDSFVQGVSDDPAVRVRDLRILVDQLAADADHLPGNDESAYRQRMADSLEGLARSLRLAQAPAMNGAFRVRIYAISGAADALRSGAVDQAVEASVTGALRAAHSALADLAADRLGGDSQIQDQLGKFDESIRQLDRERGALHRLAAANAYRQGIQTMQTISERFADRIPDDSAPAEESSEPLAPQPQE